MPHTRRTLKLEPGSWDLMLDTDSLPPARTAKIASSFVSGDGLSMLAEDMSADGFVQTFPRMSLDVTYETEGDGRTSGPTDEFGTFSVTWMRNALFSYSVSIVWRSNGSALLDGEQTIVLSVNGEEAIRHDYQLRSGRPASISFTTREYNEEDAEFDACTFSLSISAVPLLNPPSARIVVAEGAYATAQNVANECRVFEGDLAFERERGLPYYLITLGRKPSPSVLKARLRDAAMLVEDVKEVTSIEIDTLDTETRLLTGEISVTSVEGENAKIGI